MLSMLCDAEVRIALHLLWLFSRDTETCGRHPHSLTPPCTQLHARHTPPYIPLPPLTANCQKRPMLIAFLWPQVAHANQYLGALQQQNIVLSLEDRQQLIWEAVEATAGLLGADLPRAVAQNLLDEVTNLVEAPTVVLGDFDPAFLSLPK